MDSTTTEGQSQPPSITQQQTTGAPLLSNDDMDSHSEGASPKEDESNHSDAMPSPTEKSTPSSSIHSPHGYPCHLCTLVAPSQSALEEHMNIHTGSRPFHCLECGFSCSLQSTLNQHLVTHHKDAGSNGSNGIMERSPTSYESSMEQRLKEQSLAREDSDRDNDNSNNTSGMQQQVTSPVTTAAPPLQQLPGLPAVVPPTFPQHEHHEHSNKVFQCKLCTHISPTKTHLNEHMNVHSGKKPYKCLVCGFSSAFRSSLMRHLIVHTGTSKQYKCESCHYQTPYKCNLQAHRRKRHNNATDVGMDMVGSYPTPHNATSPGSGGVNNAASLLQVQDPSKLMAHIGDHQHHQSNNLDLRNRYPGLPSDTLNSFLPAALHHQQQQQQRHNSGNRPQPPSPNGSNTSASNDAQEMFSIHNKNSNPNSESGGDHPLLDSSKNHPNSNESANSSDSKDLLDYSTGALTINNDMANNASPTAPLLSAAALPAGSGPLGIPPSLAGMAGAMAANQPPGGEISVITPLQWASSAFPIYRRKKEGGARKRKRTPHPKREFLLSPSGEDMTDPWAETNRENAGSSNGSEEKSEVYRSMAREYGKGDLPNGGLDLSRDSSYMDADGMANNGSPSSDEQMKDEDGVMHSPGSGSFTQMGSLLTRSTQTDQSSQETVALTSDLASQLNKCPHCETYFADHVIFTLHMSCHGARNPYQCSICGYQCRDKIEFTCHITRSQHVR